VGLDADTLEGMATKGTRIGLGFATLWLTACAPGDQSGAAANRTDTQGDEKDSMTGAGCEPEALHEEASALPAWMAVNDDYVFWIEQRAGLLFRQAKRSAAPEVLRRNVSAWWDGLAADADAVYVGGVDGLVHRILVDGSADVALSDIGGDRASQLEAQGGFVYWLSSSGDPYRGSPGAVVRRVSANGSAASEELWSSDRASYGLAVQGEHLFVDEYTWPSPGAEPDANGVITRIGPPGQPSAPIASQLLFPRVHAADERFVYFSAQTHDAERLNQLWQVSIDGGVPELLFDGAPHGVDVGQMVVEAGVVWWGQANDGEGSVRRLSADPADVAEVASVGHTQRMLGLAADADALYFSTSFSDDDVGPGVIWRVGRQCPIE
jgi:hypothetical protein